MNSIFESCSKILVTLVSYCKLKNNLFLIYLAYKLCDDTCYGNLLEVTVVRVELLCSSRADLTKITRTKNGNRSIFNHLLRVLLILSSSSLEFRQEFHQEAARSWYLWVVFELIEISFRWGISMFDSLENRTEYRTVHSIPKTAIDHCKKFILNGNCNTVRRRKHSRSHGYTCIYRLNNLSDL